MKVDAYHVPHSFLLDLIHLVYESVCGVKCALVGVIKGWLCGESERISVSHLGFLPYFVASLGIKRNTMLSEVWV